MFHSLTKIVTKMELQVLDTLLKFIDNQEIKYRICDLAVMLESDSTPDIVNTYIRPSVTNGFTLGKNKFIKYDTPYLYKYMSKNDTVDLEISDKTLHEYQHRVFLANNRQYRYTLSDTLLYSRCIHEPKFLATTSMLLKHGKINNPVPFWVDCLAENNDTGIEDMIDFFYRQNIDQLFGFDALLYVLVSRINDSCEYFIERILDYYYNLDYMFSSAEQQYLCCAIEFQNYRGHRFSSTIYRQLRAFAIRGHPCEPWVLLQYIDKTFARHVPWRFLHWASTDDPESVGSVYSSPSGVYIHGRPSTPENFDYPLGRILAYDSSIDGGVTEENFAYLIQSFEF